MVHLMTILRYLEELEESESTCIHTASGMPWEDCILSIMRMMSFSFPFTELDRRPLEEGSSLGLVSAEW